MYFTAMEGPAPGDLRLAYTITCPGAFFAGQLYYCYFRRRMRIASKRNENTSFTVSALDRSLQNLFSRSPMYGHTNGLTTILVLLPGSIVVQFFTLEKNSTPRVLRLGY